MRVRASSLNYRDLMVLKGGGRGPAAGPKVRIRFPPAVSRQTIGSSAAEPHLPFVMGQHGDAVFAFGGTSQPVERSAAASRLMSAKLVNSRFGVYYDTVDPSPAIPRHS